jgi:uncharacterized protein
MARVIVARSRWQLTHAAVWFVLAAFVLAVAAWAEPVFPELTGRVVDEAGLLSAADKAALETDLEAFEAKSTDQIVVVTVKSLGGYPIDEFGTMLGRKWGIGQKGKDNGVLIIVAPNERKVRMEVGRRLEPLLPDGRAGSIIRETITPTFRRGDFPAGIKAGVAEVKAVLTGDQAELEQRAKRPPRPPDYSGIIITAFWLLIVIVIIRAQMQAAQQMQQTIGPDGKLKPGRRRRMDDTGPIIVWGGSGGGSGGWSGGSGGGGGFSGGGGDFGGGGASGDW